MKNLSPQHSSLIQPSNSDRRSTQSSGDKSLSFQAHHTPKKPTMQYSDHQANETHAHAETITEPGFIKIPSIRSWESRRNLNADSVLYLFHVLQDYATPPPPNFRIDAIYPAPAPCTSKNLHDFVHFGKHSSLLERPIPRYQEPSPPPLPPLASSFFLHGSKCISKYGARSDQSIHRGTYVTSQLLNTGNPQTCLPGGTTFRSPTAVLNLTSRHRPTLPNPPRMHTPEPIEAPSYARSKGTRLHSPCPPPTSDSLSVQTPPKNAHYPCGPAVFPSDTETAPL